MATNKASNHVNNAAMPEAQAPAAAAARQDGIDVQNLTRKLLKNQRSRLVPSMGFVTNASETGC